MNIFPNSTFSLKNNACWSFQKCFQNLCLCQFAVFLWHPDFFHSFAPEKIFSPPKLNEWNVKMMVSKRNLQTCRGWFSGEPCYRGVQIWNSCSYLWSLRSQGAMLVFIACHGVAPIPFRIFASFMSTLPETNKVCFGVRPIFRTNKATWTCQVQNWLSCLSESQAIFHAQKCIRYVYLMHFSGITQHVFLHHIVPRRKKHVRPHRRLSLLPYDRVMPSVPCIVICGVKQKW